MSFVSTCPACGKSISIPPRGKPHHRVRCPLCAGEFLLDDALKLAPPQLELLDAEDEHSPIDNLNMGMVAEPAAIAAAAAGAALHDAVDGPQGTDLASTKSYDPLSEESGIDLSDFESDIAAVEGKLSEDVDLDEMVFDAPEADTEIMSTDPFAEFDATERAKVADDEPVEFGEAMADDSDEPPSHDDGMFQSRGDDNEAAPSFGAISAAAKRRKKEPSAVGTLIGVVGGGVVGTALAYFIVLWIGGPEKDFLELGRKLPKWMVPAAFHEPASSVATSFGSAPSSNDVADMRRSADISEPQLKINVPELNTNNNSNPPTKLPFETDNDSAELEGSDPASPEEMLDDLTSADPQIDPLVPAAIPAPKLPSKDPTTPATDVELEMEVEADNQDTEEVTDPAHALQLPDAPEYTAADFQSALDKVTAAHADLAAAIADKSADVKKFKGQFYRSLYRLAEVMTFTPETDTLSADGLLTELAADAEMHNEIGKAGMAWFALDPAKRKGDTGIVLAGKIEAVSKKSGATILKMAPAGGGSSVFVVVPRAIDVRLGSPYLVCGTIVESPAEKLPELELKVPTVVWLGDLLNAGG